MQRSQLAKLILIVSLLSLAVLLVISYGLRTKPASASAAAYQTGSGIPAPDFDIRAPLRNALPEPPAQSGSTRQAALRFQRDAAVADLTVRWSTLTNAPSRVYSLTRPLTEPNSDDPKQIAEMFVTDNLDLLGLSPEDWREHRYTRDYLTDHNGARHFTLQQQVNGIDVFGGALNLNLDRQGRVISLSGEPMPAVRESVNAQKPVITSETAVEWAVKSAGITRLRDSQVVGLIYFPMAAGNIRLAWEVIVEDADSPSVYRTIVDAVEGNGLWRQNLTKYDHFPAHGLVYSSDSPNPNSPLGTSAGIVTRVDRPFNGLEFFPHNDPHADWWNGSGQPNRNTTISNNVSAQEDRNGNNTGGFRPMAGSGENFTFPIDLTMNPSTYQSAAITNLFYWCNRIHDIYYRLGFNEASGNFQVSNFGLGGTGNDPVQADAQDNRDAPMNPSLCNANFGTQHMDGSGARMQMFQCNSSVPEQDGDVDQEVIIHEYTHGLSGRLVMALGGCETQSGGMGEGWSDFMALALLGEPGDDLNGRYGVGGWLFNSSGIRRQFYSTNPDAPATKVFSRTYRDIRDNSGCAKGVCSNNPNQTCTVNNQCGMGNTCVFRGCNFDNQCEPPVTMVSQGPCQMECHNTGEIWANALWIARANLIRKYGFATGNQTILQLVVDGMKMSPANPTFLDARDAILMADRVDNNGVNQCLLWDAFAKMGMGKSATTTGDSDRTPVQAFDTPSTCTPNIKINAPLDLGDVCVGGTASNQLQVSNTGTGDLIVSSVARISGSSNITIDANPATPVFIAGGSHVDFTVRCSPSSSGTKTATIRVKSNDPDQPELDLSYICNAPAPKIATVIVDSGNFGDVCVGSFKDLSLTISNSGGCDLTVNGITFTPATDFLLPNVLSFPLVIHAGDSIEVPIRFHPATKGNQSATVRIFSDDPTTPIKIVSISGTALAPSIIVNDPIIFDKTCPGNTNNQTLTIGNSGACDLVVKSITSNSADFKVVGVVPFPLIVPPGSTRNVTIQFMPMGFTANPMRMAELTIMSNDPDMVMKTVTVKGTVPPPVIQAMPDPLDFDKVCLGTFKDLPLTIKNTGECNLTVTSIMSNSLEFKLAAAVPFPIVIQPGGMRDVQIRFEPTNTGVKSAKLTINSDDPATPNKMVTVMGIAPVSDIAISGPTDFGSVTVGKFRDQVLNISNTEPCDLLITLVCEVTNNGIVIPSTEFNVATILSYPVLIPGRDTLPITIRFKPERTGPRAANLIVFGFDPKTSSLVLTKTVPLTGKGK